MNYYNSPDHVLPDDYQRKLIHAYAACISFVDAQVGKLIESLKETGKYDNTIIVFISDHGYHLGHQQKWGKTTNFENSTRAPLIVSAPNYKKGKRSTQFVEYVDLYATLCDLADIEIPNTQKAPVSNLCWRIRIENGKLLCLASSPGEEKWKAIVCELLIIVIQNGN